MTIQLSPDSENFIQDKVKTGVYKSAEDVVHQALKLLEERDFSFAVRKDEIRQKINEGLESLRRGAGLDGEEVFARLETECAEIVRV